MAAESIGLAASFTGLVSLGIQVTSGIIKYVDAFKNRQEELEFVKRHGEVLRAALLAVDSSLRSHNQSGDVPATVAQSMQLFEKELGHVQTLHTALADSDPQSLTARLGNKKKRVTFAFNRPRIQELGMRIQKASDALQLTLNLLGLQVLNQNKDTLAAVGSSTKHISSEISLVRSELAAIQAPIVKIDDRLSRLQYGVDSNSQLLISQYEALSTQAQGRSDYVLRNVQETTNAVQQLAQLQSRREEEMTRQHKEMTKNLGQILEHFQQSHDQKTARQAVVRGLAGKPALLKELSDKIQPSGKIHNQVAEPDLVARPFHKMTKSSIRHHEPQTVTRRICICPRLQTSTKSKWIQLGDAYFSRERETKTHWPGCPMVKMESQRRMSMGLTYNGLVRILKKAVNVSFVMKSGAGGFSISPNFTCSPTVDHNRDTAFRILTLIGTGLLYLRETNPESFIVFYWACMRRLTRLLNDRKVCATAVDRQNMSLMHYAILALQFAGPDFYGEKQHVIICSFFVELVQTLLSFGVAAFTFDLEGTSPLLKLSTRLFEYDIPQAVVDVLTQANPENKPLALDRSCIARIYEDPYLLNLLVSPISLYKLSSNFAEVSESGPLSMAVIRGDANELRHMLNRAPGSIAETNIFGQTPFHLAATKPRMLEILLKHGDHSTIDQRDISGFTALETAMIRTSDYCDNREDANRCDGSECRCCQCVDLFLDAECDIRMHQLAEPDDAPPLNCFLRTASELARRKYVYSMKRRQDSAIRSTSLRPHASTKSNDYDLLTNSGIAKFGRNTTGSSQPEVADDMSWVFLEIDDPHLAALFYRHGFQPHPSCLTHFQDFRKKRMNYAYLDWLILHAVELGFRSLKLPASTDNPPYIGLFGAHFAFYSISLRLDSRSYNNTSWQDTRSWDKYMALTARICRQNLSDGCQCHCTTDGCSPFTWMMKGSSLMSGSQVIPATINRWDIEILVSHYSRCGFELTSLTYKAAIRYATFGALGLIHTCCDARDLVQGSGNWANRGDLDTVNEEQAPLLKVLEDLVEEFEEKAVEFLRADSSGNSLFAQFWELCWKDRIEEELEKLEGEELTDAERRGAEEIGVRWTVSRQELEAGNPYDYEDLEYWFYELDEICPEYVEPWPEELRRVSELP